MALVGGCRMEGLDEDLRFSAAGSLRLDGPFDMASDAVTRIHGGHEDVNAVPAELPHDPGSRLLIR